MSDVLQRLGDAIKMLNERDAELARLTAELERSSRECEGLRAGIDSAMRAYENECYHAANAYLHKALEEVAALSAGGSDGNA